MTFRLCAWDEHETGLGPSPRSHLCISILKPQENKPQIQTLWFQVFRERIVFILDCHSINCQFSFLFLWVRLWLGSSGWLGTNSLWRRAWPGTHGDPPASSFWELRVEACTTVHSANQSSNHLLFYMNLHRFTVVTIPYCNSKIQWISNIHP